MPILEISRPRRAEIPAAFVPKAASFREVVKEFPTKRRRIVANRSLTNAFGRERRSLLARVGRTRTISDRALDRVSFDINKGEVFGLLGPNRAGKTTLAKILLTLCKPTSGEVDRLGASIAERSTLSRVGYVHENPAFPRYLTAESTLAYYGALSGASTIAVAVRIPLLLERVGLADRAFDPITRFSKGMIARLNLAQALINEPDLLVLDEPGEGLDLPGRKLLREIIVDFRARGKTVLLISHQLGDVEALCDRIAVLIEGKLAALGPIADFVGRGEALENRLLDLYTMEKLG